MATPQASDPSSSKGPRDFWKPVMLLVTVVCVAVLARVFGWDAKLLDLKNWIHALGVWAPLVFVAVYALLTILAVPGTFMSLIAGGVFGSFYGVMLVSLSSTLGACLAFLVGRYFAREAITRRFAGHDMYQRLDGLTEKHGAIIVALVRLIPLFPFNVVNYGFGLTGVRFQTYAFWSWLCMLPGTVFYVVGADTLATAIVEGGVPWTLVLVLAAAAVLLLLLIHLAYRLLQQKEERIHDGKL